MTSKAMQIAVNVTAVLEEKLGHDFTVEHDVFFDPDVDDAGTPYVSVGVSGQGGVEKLAALFGDSVLYGDRQNENAVRVPIVVYSVEPGARLN